MQKKNEYQIRANALFREIVGIPTTKVTTDGFEKNGEIRTKTFRMCHVNGEKYILSNDLNTYATQSLDTLEAKGIISEGDIRHFVADGGKVANSFIRLPAIVGKGNELTEYFKRKDFYGEESKNIIPILEAAEKAVLPEICIDGLEFIRSEEAYHERLEAIAEGKKFKREQRYQEDLEWEREKEQKRIEEGKEEERTLRDLVEQIEAMGWNVTLTYRKV